MIRTRLVLIGIVCVLAAGWDGLTLRRVAAAGSPAPTVSVLRNAALAQTVWPGDFNGDGIVDLASTARRAAGAPPASIQISLGHGNGTFQAPVPLGVSGHVLAVADFNRDGRADLLATGDRDTAGPVDVFILIGNGNGTFTTRWRVGSALHPTFGIGADMDDDGTADVVIVDDDNRDSVTFYPNPEDGTFLSATQLYAGPGVRGAAVGDFNHDGCPDLAIANFDGNSVTIFQCQGLYAYTTTDIPVGGSPDSVAAADLNGDGKIDVVAAVADGGDTSRSYFDAGRAVVLLGNGDATFRAPVSYDVARGAWEIVVGDFTRDGIVDIATANRSSIYYDALCWPYQTWDSVSILPGTGDGTFAAPSHFSIGNQMKPEDGYTDRNTVVSLTSADLNGDHAPDLVVSNGTVFLNRAADPNWTPTVDAGPDQTITGGDHFVALHAKANDVDQDMLSYAWYDSGGDSIPPVPSPCFTPHTLGVHTYTVVVDDGHGHTATDSVQVDFGSPSGGGGEPTTLSVIAPAAGETIAAGTPYTIRFHVEDPAEAIYEWTIRYSLDNGATWNNIWECHQTGRPSGPGVPDSRDEQCTWNNPGPASAQAIIHVAAQDDADAEFAGANSGVFTIRAADGGVPYPWRHQDIGAVARAGSLSYSGGTFTVSGSGADIWGTADEFHYAYLDANATGNQASLVMIARVDTVQNVNPWTKAGVMIRNSLSAGSPQASVFVSPSKGIVFQRRLAQGGSSFSTQGPLIAAPVWVRITMQPNGFGETVKGYYRTNPGDPWTLIGQDNTAGPWYQPVGGIAVSSHADGTLATATFSNVAAGRMPGWNASTVGPYAGTAAGDADGNVLTVRGRGTDIWNSADQFMYVWDVCTGNCSITARVRSLENVNAWAKAGVMFRETLDGGSRQADMIVSPSKGAAMQYRAATGGASAQAGAIAGAPPAWLRLTRVGNVFTGYWSTDGETFTAIGSTTTNMPDVLYVGLVATSHTTSASAEGVFDNVVVQQP